jgi:FixJ family two-component response regulator
VNVNIHAQGAQPLRLPSALPSVHVVDDDAPLRVALARLLGSAGCYRVHAHACADDFLAAYDPEAPGCVLLDIGLPGLNGLGLQDKLRERADPVSIVFLSGCADVPMCAGAMRHGAVDFLTKPVDEATLFTAVARAVERDAGLRAVRAQQAVAASRLATLTPREREVITHVMAGRLNKQIASDLGTAEKTIKVHRARGMEKMHVRSVAELVRLVERGRMSADWAGTTKVPLAGAA